MLKKIFFSLFISCAAYGQIKYVPITINQCTGEHEYDVFVLINRKGERYMNEGNDTITVPEPGVYKVYQGVYADSFSIELTDAKISTDTFYTTKLNLALYISNPPFSEYFSCDEKANGLVTDYYFDGTIRQTGTFKDGQLDGFLKIYSYSGKLKEMHFEHKKKWSKTEYYANGTIKSYTGNINGFECKEYYENEKLKSYETSSEFILYSVQGVILQYLTWKKIRRSKFFKDDNRMLYQYTFRRYKDSGAGYKTQETIFESYTEPYFFQKETIDEVLSNSTIRQVGFYCGEEQVIRIETDKDRPGATLSIKTGKKWQKEKLATQEELSAAIVKYAEEFN